MHTGRHALDWIHVSNTGVPIYVQLRDQFLGAIGQGVLKSGDQMPTMRQVAVHLRVDLNTVRHAYEELERLGALALVRGRGSFVAEPPQPTDPATVQTQLETLARPGPWPPLRAQGIDPAMRFAIASRRSPRRRRNRYEQRLWRPTWGSPRPAADRGRAAPMAPPRCWR